MCAPGQACINGLCPPGGVACDDGNDVDWDGCSSGEIVEFQVNQHQAGSQIAPVAGYFPDGAYLVAWRGPGSDGEGIQGRSFNPSGSSETPEVLLVEIPEHKLVDFAVVMIAGGRFAVVWSSSTQVCSSWCADDPDCPGEWCCSWDPFLRVRFQLFNEDMTPAGGPVMLASHAPESDDYSYNNKVSASPMANGGLVVAWDQCWYDEGWADTCQVLASKSDSDGAVVFSSMVAYSSFLPKVMLPAVTGFVDERFVVAWHPFGTWIPAGEIVTGQVYALTGNKWGGAFKVSSQELAQFGPDPLAALNSGSLVVAWRCISGGVFAQCYDPEGFVVQDQLPISSVGGNATGPPAVAGLADGGVVFAWEDELPNSGGDRIVARRFSDSLNVGEDEFQVTTGMGYQASHPFAVGSPQGDLLFVWQSYGQNGDGWDIFAQRFGGEGTKEYR